MGDLHNRNGHVPSEEWEKEDGRITKDVLDNRELDYDALSLHGNQANATTSVLSAFNPAEHINVQYIKAYYCGPQEGALTRVSEKKHLMQWRGEHFKCRVGIALDSAMPKTDWTIGLAQACDYLHLVNKFDGGGHYSWELHPLKSGIHSMVNDSNGSQWPFYSHRQSMVDIKANQPTKQGFIELRFSDYFYPTMHWGVETGGAVYSLSSVTRRQGFKVWLLAVRRGASTPKDGYCTTYSQLRPQTDDVYVLSSMQWRFNIDLKFDCQMPLGNRCTSIQDIQDEQPVVFDTIDNLPTSALVPPNCNSCQSLIFYPENKKHSLVLKKEPEEAIVPWMSWRETMTKGYSVLEGFEQPIPPPAVHVSYRGDPALRISRIPCGIKMSQQEVLLESGRISSQQSASVASFM